MGVQVCPRTIWMIMRERCAIHVDENYSHPNLITAAEPRDITVARAMDHHETNDADPAPKKTCMGAAALVNESTDNDSQEASLSNWLTATWHWIRAMPRP